MGYNLITTYRSVCPLTDLSALLHDLNQVIEQFRGATEG